jgi:hypothetical protein
MRFVERPIATIRGQLEGSSYSIPSQHSRWFPIWWLGRGNLTKRIVSWQLVAHKAGPPFFSQTNDWNLIGWFHVEQVSIDADQQHALAAHFEYADLLGTRHGPIPGGMVTRGCDASRSINRMAITGAPGPAIRRALRSAKTSLPAMTALSAIVATHSRKKVVYLVRT